MTINMPRLSAAVLLAVSLSALAQPASTPGQSAAEDQRQLVSMPAPVVHALRQEMRDNLAALNEIIGQMAEGKWDTAGETAEKRLGRSSMGQHRGTGLMPGRYMPAEMHQIGFAMHDAASEFAAVTRQGDAQKSFAALQKITGACVACHYGYRVR